MNLPEAFRDKVRTGVPLKFRTSLRVGGKAQYWFEPKDRDELIEFLKSSDKSLPLFVIGAGSNLLIREGLIRKVFISLESPSFRKVEINGVMVTAGAGVKVDRLIAVLSLKNIGGYEFLAGIPGSLGGLVAMNAGAKTNDGCWKEMKDVVCEVEALDRSGRPFRFKKRDLKFSYRNSNLRSHIILSATLRLKREDRLKVRRSVTGIIKARLESQDSRYPSAGSFFKNTQNSQPAGRLIDLCGLKGLKVGGAQVSRKHANFIINTSGAKSTDVIKLMEIISKRVYNQFKIKLMPEVEIVS